jgi:uncharacterized protein (TIGR03437 family)
MGSLAVCYLLLATSAVAASAQVQQYVISTFAGGAAPSTPTVAVNAEIGLPIGVTADGAGNLYFVSADLNSVFKLTREGSLSVIVGSSKSGSPGDGGAAMDAVLKLAALIGEARPGGLAIDRAGNLFIADAGNHRIRRVSPSGLIVTVAGTGTSGFSGDGGPALNAQLSYPTGVAVDALGNLFIADAVNYRVRKVSTSGIVTTFAGNGQCCFSGDGGPATGAALAPFSLATDNNGNLLVSDSRRIRRISPDGIINTLPASDTSPGWVGGLAVDSAGNVFAASLSCIRKISPAGIMTIVAGDPTAAGFSGDGGTATNAKLLNAFDAAVDGTGNLYIADTANGRIRKVSPDGIITTVAGNGSVASTSVPATDGGPATSAQLHPQGVATDNTGNVFIGDAYRIRRVSVDGTITTVAGTGTAGFSGDGGPAIDAQLGSVSALALDSAGNLFFGESGTTGARVRKISTSGIIATVAGTGAYRFPNSPDEGGPAINASLGFVGGLAVDAAGNLFISDFRDNRVRKVSPDGIIRTAAGGGGSFGDGGNATDATLGCPRGIVIDAGGNLLIAEYCRGSVRKVSRAAIITTVAGAALAYSAPSGDGGAATAAAIPAPTALAVDRAGNIFIADTYIDDFGPLPCCDERIRRVSPDGIITTIAGIGLPGYSGDGGPAVTAALNLPTGVAVDPAGNIYVADSGNDVVRVLRPSDRALLIGAVVDAASQHAIAVSPGKIVVIYGAGLGPEQLVQNQPAGGRFGTESAGTTVSFNGIAAPILYTSATQVGALVPYGIAATTAQVAVAYQGQVSNSFNVAVAPAAPSLFTANQQGWGQAAAVNARDGTVNTAANPVGVGGYISLFATGEGQTLPGGVDGKLGGSTAATPLLPVSVMVGGISAVVQYAGGVAGQVAGLMQVNVRVPDGVQPGGYVPVVLQVGDASSARDVVWIAISGN